MKEFEIIGTTVISRAFKEDVFQIVERILKGFLSGTSGKT